MATLIAQRELRNNNADILNRVEAGESFVVTRNGIAVADVVPHAERKAPPMFPGPKISPRDGGQSVTPCWTATRGFTTFAMPTRP